MSTAELDARAAAEARFLERYAEEFEELFRVLCLRRGLTLVMISRTVTKQVSEQEAELLCSKFGWERVNP